MPGRRKRGLGCVHSPLPTNLSPNRTVAWSTSVPRPTRATPCPPATAPAPRRSPPPARPLPTATSSPSGAPCSRARAARAAASPVMCLNATGCPSQLLPTVPRTSRVPLPSPWPPPHGSRGFEQYTDHHTVPGTLQTLQVIWGKCGVPLPGAPRVPARIASARCRMGLGFATFSRYTLLAGQTV